MEAVGDEGGVALKAGVTFSVRVSVTNLTDETHWWALSLSTSAAPPPLLTHTTTNTTNTINARTHAHAPARSCPIASSGSPSSCGGGLGRRGRRDETNVDDGDEERERVEHKPGCASSDARDEQTLPTCGNWFQGPRLGGDSIA